MALWFKNLVFIPLLALALMLGNGYYHSCDLVMPQHKAMQMASEMPCHDMAAAKMPDHKKADNHQKNCCDTGCNCSYGHCNGTIAITAPNFAIIPQFIGNIQSPQAMAFAIITTQAPPERPPKDFS